MHCLTNFPNVLRITLFICVEKLLREESYSTVVAVYDEEIEFVGTAIKSFDRNYFISAKHSKSKFSLILSQYVYFVSKYFFTFVCILSFDY